MLPQNDKNFHFVEVSLLSDIFGAIIQMNPTEQ